MTLLKTTAWKATDLQLTSRDPQGTVTSFEYQMT